MTPLARGPDAGGVEQAVDKSGKVRMLAEFHDFHGWDMHALWDDIKFATKQFLADINSIPAANVKKIEDMAYKSAVDFITAFRAKGTATLVEKRLLGK